MIKISYTLLSDGSSDRCLIKVIDWCIQRHLDSVAITSNHADFHLLQNPPRLKNLDQRIIKSLELYPSDILFIHRDAEGENVNHRKSEIEKAIKAAKREFDYVVVIPKRMTEAWLLISHDAITKAAGNRRYSNLKLPKINSIENLNDPKDTLHSLLKEAGETNRSRINPHHAVHLVAEFIDDFSPLLNLSAFKDFDDSLKSLLNAKFAY